MTVSRSTFVSGTDFASNAAFAKEYRANFSVLTRENDEMIHRYKVRVTPFAFYIDEDGVVRAKGIVNVYSQLAAMTARAGLHAATSYVDIQKATDPVAPGGSR